MRRAKPKLLVVALLAIVAVVVTALSTGTASTAPKAQYSVALLTTGATNNRSWANAWTIGAQKAAKDFKVKLTVVGNLDAPDAYVSQGSSFASKGYNLIIFAHGAMQGPAVKLAKQFPKVEFVQAPFEFKTKAEQVKSEPPNVGHADAEQQYGAFLAGALAGLVTKSNKVGAVYAFPFPALTRQPEAFRLGAECTNPKVQFSQKQTNSFTDAALARSAASSLISGGADVVFAAVDQAVQGVIAAAQSAPHTTYAIPSYFDDHSLGPKVVLTSVLYNLQGVAYDLIKRGVQGKLGPHFYYSYNLKNLRVGELAPYYNLGSVVSSAAKSKLTQIRANVLSGKIRVPDETQGSPTIGTLNSAAKISPKSIGC
jgi:basic membrane protein A and related proteins